MKKANYEDDWQYLIASSIFGDLPNYLLIKKSGFGGLVNQNLCGISCREGNANKMHFINQHYVY